MLLFSPLTIFPGINEAAPILSNEPVFAEKKLEHLGQIIGAVVANSLAEALQGAEKVKLDIEHLDPGA